MPVVAYQPVLALALAAGIGAAVYHHWDDVCDTFDTICEEWNEIAADIKHRVERHKRRVRGEPVRVSSMGGDAQAFGFDNSDFETEYDVNDQGSFQPERKTRTHNDNGLATPTASDIEKENDYEEDDHTDTEATTALKSSRSTTGVRRRNVFLRETSSAAGSAGVAGPSRLAMSNTAGDALDDQIRELAAQDLASFADENDPELSIPDSQSSSSYVQLEMPSSVNSSALLSPTAGAGRVHPTATANPTATDAESESVQSDIEALSEASYVHSDVDWTDGAPSLVNGSRDISEWSSDDLD